MIDGNNKFKPTERSSIKSGRSHKYLVINELPSGFRGYKIDTLYVRGLFFEESEALSKYVGNHKPSYKQLVTLYRDVIQGIELEDLELPDFILLMIISSIWTVKGFGWIPNLACIHDVPNKHKATLQVNIEKLYEDMTVPECDIVKLSEEVKKIEAELEFTPDTVKCDGILNTPIVLDDLEIKDSSIKKTPIPIKIEDKDYGVSGLTVGNTIEIEDFMELYPNENKLYVTYASLLSSVDNLSLDERLKIIKYSATPDIQNLKKLDEDLFIKVEPVIKHCPKCHNLLKIYIGLTKLKAYP